MEVRVHEEKKAEPHQKHIEFASFLHEPIGTYRSVFKNQVKQASSVETENRGNLDRTFAIVGAR